jgi:uncharacterized membrane protein YeaQ/YmgE (transglycosylase-associated protein family)
VSNTYLLNRGGVAVAVIIKRSKKEQVMGIILWIIFGALAGWIASMIAGTNKQQGALGNIIVGILGAVVGGFIVQLLGGSGVTGFNVWSLLVAVGGAVILLMLKKALMGHRKGE